MHLRTVAWLLLLTLNAAFGEQKQDKIDWQLWSDSVFAQAKKEGRFVLLNLGAVWCHWCHVMDDVTYRDPKVIELIRSHYVDAAREFAWWGSSTCSSGSSGD